MYDPKSLKAEEFICHEEIEDTLKYADENKDNLPLIREILDKARLCKGLSHREASVLLACEDPEILDEIYKLANEIKHEVLRQPHRHVRAAVPFQLLRERLRLLPVSLQKQAHRRAKS